MLAILYVISVFAFGDSNIPTTNTFKSLSELKAVQPLSSFEDRKFFHKIVFSMFKC